MNVGELISKLGKYPKDTLVLVDGYEDGYDPIIELEEATVELNSYEAGYLGDYDDAESEGELAIIIPRGKLDD